ncbi:calmodulin binding protein PICBP-like [Dendrobium catenatum]|uniref:Calmodulin-binding domain-containing protein n=1 Tax=Dendrobium catenatum TaxID=906689 RepID=A0A2I0VPV5_9ASPA|nr:calmodulin binding protein PICBP-like [Dendrobium catenatum]PKU65437.1 hypothetical protein MA16_Dca013582 [Dendrobium catenatum]
MVLRKMLDKFRSRSETKKVSEEPEKIDSSKQQKQDGGHGGGETKKKLKKVRSIRVADFDGIRKAPKKTSQNPLSKSPQQATDEVPNYMKFTSSYDARKEKSKVPIDSSTPITATSKSLSSAARVLVKNSSLKLLRSSMKKNKGKNNQSSIYKTRANRSSPIKDSETPESVDLKEHQDALALKVCPYTFCSLHGHKHGAVPSLKRILSSRRQSLKVQKSMKLRGYSSIKKSGDKEAELVENVVNELFIEIHSKLQEWGEDSFDDAEKIYIFDRMNKMKLEGPNDESQLQESCSVTSFEDCGEKNSELSMEDIQVITQFLKFIEQECDEEAQSETEKSEKAATVDNLLVEEYKSMEEDWTKLEAGCVQRQKDISKANLKSFVVENNVKDCSSQGNRSKVKYSKLRRQPSKFRESVKEINRRPPRLLELQDEPEQEQVNLKHQTVDERKAAEEWMIDNALSKALRRLASTRKKKVPLLVAAFEAVMPQMCETHMCHNGAGNLGQKQDQ